MMHEEIEDQEIIERYVRNQLAPEERQAFEEHFFACDACFEKLQATERFVAGIRDAAARGVLPGTSQASLRSWRTASWWIPAFGAAALAALLLAAETGWLYFVQRPKLRERLAESDAQLQTSQEARAALERQLQQNLEAEANVPLVMLQSTRDLQASLAEASLPHSSARLVLWIEVPAGPYRAYRLEIYSTEAKPIETLEHLTRNSYGALAAGVPAGQLPPGDFRIKLFGEEPPPASLLAEYRLRIRKP
jgi:hypothetical protein